MSTDREQIRQEIDSVCERVYAAIEKGAGDTRSHLNAGVDELMNIYSMTMRQDRLSHESEYAQERLSEVARLLYG